MTHGGRSLSTQAIEPPSLLSFTWKSVNTDLEPTMVTVEFRERAATPS